MSEVVYINDFRDLESVLYGNHRVVVDFSAPGWCIPCRRLAPHFHKAAENSSAVFVEIDIDNADERIREHYDIQSVPTVILFEDGEQSKVITGRTVVQILQQIA